MEIDRPNTELNVSSVAWNENQDALPTQSSQTLQELRKIIGTHLTKHKSSRSFREMNGCLDRLDSFLLQTSRMIRHADIGLFADIPGMPSISKLPCTSWLSVSAQEARTDFESQLFHSRAALDRLTWFVSQEYKQQCNRFSRLPNVLRVFEKNSDIRAIRARDILALLRKADNDLKGLVTNLGDGHSLRSKVTHYNSLVEGTTSTFTVLRLTDGRFLVFDYEAYGYPIIATSRKLAIGIPFLVLNVLSIFLERKQLPRTAFLPSWKNVFVVHSRFIDSSKTGLLFPITESMVPNGAKISYVHLNPSVLDMAVVTRLLVDNSHNASPQRVWR